MQYEGERQIESKQTQTMTKTERGKTETERTQTERQREVRHREEERQKDNQTDAQHIHTAYTDRQTHKEHAVDLCSVQQRWHLRLKQEW